MSEADRAAQLMRQRMARANETMHMQNPPPQQRAMYAPPPPSMSMPRPSPPPPGAPKPVTNLTGSSRRIPPKSDPLNRYKNLKEKQTAEAEDEKGNMLMGVNHLVVGVITAIAFSAIFVLPRQLKVFWVLVMGLTLLMVLGLMLYKELMEMSKGGGENAKYSEWAWVLLFALIVMYTGVMVGILIFMAWSLYSIANSKTNIARNDRAAGRDQGHSEVYV